MSHLRDDLIVCYKGRLIIFATPLLVPGEQDHGSTYGILARFLELLYECILYKLYKNGSSQRL